MTLPFELYRVIFSYFNTDNVDDRTALAALSATSKAVNAEAERVLYRRFVGYMLLATHIKFLRSVASPNRASAVEAYSFNPVYFRRQLTDELEELLPLRLKTFVNLKALEFRWPGWSAPFLADEYPFRLESFAWCQREFRESCAESVLKLLRNQPGLKHILYTDAPFREPLPDLPALETICSSWKNLPSFLSASTNIKSMIWIPAAATEFNSAPLDSGAAAVAPALKALQTLDIHVAKSVFLWMHYAAPVFPYFSNVETLHVSLGETPADIRTVDPLIRSLPKLRLLSYNMDLKHSIPLSETLAAFALAPTLQAIQMTWVEHPSSAETIRQGSIYLRTDSTDSNWNVWLQEQVVLDPVPGRVCDSILSLTHAVTIPV
jgi:hypothetical protein